MSPSYHALKYDRVKLARPAKWYYHNAVRFEFADSADEYGILRLDAVYAVLHHVDYEILQPRRTGEQSLTFVGLPHPQALCHLEVGVTVNGRGRRPLPPPRPDHRPPTTDHQEQPS